MKQKQAIFHNILLYSIFLIYIAILFMLLFMRSNSSRSYNIIPFHTINNYLFSDDIIIRSFAVSNLVGNIILFFPLGAYITLFNRNKSVRTNVIWVLIIGVVVEICQYILMRGVADIDDIILYLLGGGIGIMAYRTLLFFFKDAKRVRYVVEIIAPITGVIFFLALFLYNR